MSEMLENLFGSRERARLLRFFLQNPDQEYASNEIITRNMLNVTRVRKELVNLANIKFVIKRIRKGKVYYILNQEFNFYPELKNLIVKSNIYPQCHSLGRVKNLGNIRFAAIGGVFINYPKSKADMILVGDGVSRARLNNLMNNLEAEVGREITYVLMSQEEFKYRLNMLDKFVLDFLEGPNEELVNKIPGLRKFIADRK